MGLSLSAANLLPNGSFELGTQGYGLGGRLLLDTNPKQEMPLLDSAVESAAAGNHILRVQNPHGDVCWICSRNFRLKPDTKYTLRFRAKSTAPGQEIRATIFNTSDWRNFSDCFTLQKTWNQYEFKFKTGPKDGLYPFQLRLGISGKNKPLQSELCFDDLELFESQSKPVKGVELALSVPQDLFVTDTVPTISVTLKAGNFTASPWQGTITVDAEDEFQKGMGVVRKVDLKLAPGEIKKIQIPFNLKYGAYWLTANAKNIQHSIPAAVAVIGKYEPKKLDFNRDFCVGVNGGLNLVQTGNYPLGVSIIGISPDQYLDYLSKMGCRMMREHDGGIESTRWAFAEPQPGAWDFRCMDFVLHYYEKYGIEPLACVGRGFFIVRKPWPGWLSKGFPDWVVALSPPAKQAAYNWPNTKGDVFLPPMDHWREYVRRVSQHAKGRIHYYEALNEPNGYISAEEYTPYLKTLYEEVKKNDPAAKVLGLCVTSDFGAVGDRFVTDAIKAGAGGSMDIATLHPYNGRELSSMVPADQYIANFRKTLGPGCSNMPVWNSELYFLYDTDDPKEGNCNPGQVAARFLTDLGEHVGQSTSVHMRQVWRNLLVPGDDDRGELTPNGNFVAYNALARYYEGAKVIAKYKLPEDVIAYLYRRKNGQLIAAVWNWGKKTGINVDLTGLTVLDVYGNRLKDGVLPASGYPYYLLPGKMSETEFTKKIKSLPVVVEDPLAVAPIVRMVQNGEQFLALATIHNAASKKKNVLAGFSGGGFVAVKSVGFEIAANSDREIRIPLKKATVGTPPAVSLYSAGRLKKYPVRISVNPAIFSGDSVLLKKDDLQAEWKIEPKKDKIIFEITVVDSTDSGSRADGREPWEQDCVELFFDTAPEQLAFRHPDIYTKNCFRLFLLPRLPVDRQCVAWSRDDSPLIKSEIRHTVEKTKNGYRIRLEVPLSVSPATDLLGFDVKVDDARAGEKTYRAISWTNSPNGYKDRTAFGIINRKQAK